MMLTHHHSPPRRWPTRLSRMGWLARMVGWIGLSALGQVGAFGVESARAQALTNSATGSTDGVALDTSGGTVTLNLLAQVATRVVGEISPNEIPTGATSALTLDLLPTVHPGDTGISRLEITAPPGFANLAVVRMSVGQLELGAKPTAPLAGEYSAQITGSLIVIDLGSRITGSGNSIQVLLLADGPPAAGPGTFDVVAGNGPLIRAAIPGDADGDGTDANSLTVDVVFSQGRVLDLALETDRRQAVVGEVVTYSVLVRNTIPADVDSVTVESVLPPGFSYVEGSAYLDGVPVGDPIGHRALGFAIGNVSGLSDTNGNGEADPGEPGFVLLDYQAVVGAGASPGVYESEAVARDFCATCFVSNVTRIEVDVTPAPEFDLGTIVGKVFEDANEDGYQDSGEIGVPGARVVLDDGTIASTDDHGRFHFPVVAPGQRMVKLDHRSLSAPATITTDDSHILWMTPGILGEANFGVHRQMETETIGQPASPGISVASDHRSPPVDVHGNVETQSLLVNGVPLMVPSAGVSLLVDAPEEVVQIAGSELEEPVRFWLDAGGERLVATWLLSILDADDQTIRGFAGDGALPPYVTWDGRDDGGTLIQSGAIYTYQLVVSFVDGSAGASDRRLFGVNRTAIIALEMTGDAFEVGSDVLSEEAREVLREAAAILESHPHDAIVIEGHTDDQGSPEYNLELSRRRAESAAAYLASITPFESDHFHLQWHGEGRPIVPNDFPEGRAINRRVEIRGAALDTEVAAILDQYRTTPEATVNGSAVELGEHGRFATRIDADSTETLTIEMRGSAGATTRTSVPIPQVEILSPRGAQILPLGESEDGWFVADIPDSTDESGRVTAVGQLVGLAPPDHRVEVDGTVLPIEADGTFRTDLHLSTGLNVFGLLVTNPDGVTRIVNLEVAVSNRDADGNVVLLSDAVPSLTVGLPPADIELPSTQLTLTGVTDPGNRVEVNGRKARVGGDGRFRATTELPRGSSTLLVTSTDPQGRVGGIEREVRVVRNELFLLAFVEGEYGKLEADGNIEGAGLEEPERYYTQGRIAYYLKGVIAGKYLITSALDTGRDEIDRLFDNLDGLETDRLLRNIDPDKLYPVYGDSSSVTFDAQSQGKFYLSVDSEEVSALVGNSALAIEATELARYQRTLYGGRVAYQSASRTRYGDPDTQIILFAADVRFVHVRDELQATGGSIYYLSHRDLIEGGEQITLVVRDKNTGLVLTRRPQRQNVDYTIKYPEGRVMFRRPIEAVVTDGSLVDQELLAGNPMFIQVDYEHRDELFEDSALGGRVRKQVGDHVALGGTYVEDTPTTGSYELVGADAELRLKGNTRIIGEYAESKGADSNVFMSRDGGLTYEPASTSGLPSGKAWKAAAEVDVSEWWDDPGRLWVKAHLKTLETGFVSNGNALEQGTTKIGVSGGLKLGEGHTVAVRHHREDLGDVAGATPESLDKTTINAAQWEITRRWWGAALEYYASSTADRQGRGVNTSSFGAGMAWLEFFGRIRTRAEHQTTLQGPTNDQTTVGAEIKVLPSLALDVEGTQGTLGRAVQGGAALAVGESRLYLTERVADAGLGTEQSTIVGAESHLGRKNRVYSEYQWVRSPVQDRTISLIGLQRQWDLGTGFKVITSGEASRVTADSTQLTRTAVAGLVSYGRPGLRASAWNEIRLEDGTTRRLQFLTWGQLDLQLGSGFAFLGRYRYSQTRDRDTDAVEAEFNEHSVGLAYRPLAHNRVNALARYTYLSDLRPVNTAVSTPSDRTMSVVSVDASVDLTRWVEWVSKGAARILDESPTGRPEIRTHTYLGIQRFNLNAWRRLYLGVEYRMLRQTEANDQLEGWLADLSWRLSRHLRLGTGYNFTEFSDNEFTMNDYSVRGWFVRAQGRY